MRVVAVTVRVVLVVLLGMANAQAIVNGAPASDEDFAARFPWAVALVDRKSGSVCTAQLVSPTWVLTAAHCTSRDMEVRNGHASRTLAGVVPVVEAIPHPRYDSATGRNDVGLIRLAAAAAARPVPLLGVREAQFLLREGTKAVIAGWGHRSPRSGFSERLIVSDVELRSLAWDDSRFGYSDSASGPCGGDSGGPLLVTRSDGTLALAGVASRVVGDLCAQGGGVGIYVDVSRVRDFIRAHVKDLPGADSP